MISRICRRDTKAKRRENTLVNIKGDISVRQFNRSLFSCCSLAFPTIKEKNVLGNYPLILSPLAYALIPWEKRHICTGKGNPPNRPSTSKQNHPKKRK